MPTVAFGHRRRIVHAVADHGDLLLGAQLLDRLDLILWHQVAPGLVKPDILGDRLGDLLMVRREIMIIRLMPSACSCASASPGSSAWRIHQPDRAEFLVAMADDHRGAAAFAQFRDCCRRSFAQCGDAVGAEHLGLADPDRLAVERRGHPASGEALEIMRLRDVAPAQALASVARNCSRQRVVAELLDRDGDPQQLFFRNAFCRDDIGDAWAAFRQRAGLVEGQSRSASRDFRAGAPPFTRTPPRAARATPDSTALGVAIASAQGLAATSTAMAR